jgi:CheY-like chemotaxis protein
VLVVEGNVGLGRFATWILQDLGYETTWAANGDAALAHLDPAGSCFDAAFSDEAMPARTGRTRPRAPPPAPGHAGGLDQRV